MGSVPTVKPIVFWGYLTLAAILAALALALQKLLTKERVVLS